MARTLKKKMLILILCCVFVISGMITGFFILRNGTYEGEVRVVEELTREQYEFLQAAVLPGEFEEMSDVERRNAWIFLNGMEEVGFNENVGSSGSGVAFAAWILDMLDIGEIVDFKIVEEVECEDGINLWGWFIAQIINQDGDVYYVQYFRTCGEIVVRKDGKRIYSRHTHIIFDGQIYEREYPRGPAIRD